MEPLEPAGFSSYGYTPYPCEFRHIFEELEKMTGTDVNAIVQVGMSSREVLRMSGRLGLAETVPGFSPKRVHYAVGDGEHEGFDICEEEFTRAQMIPGMVWVEIGPHVLVVERRHFPPELESASLDCANADPPP